MKSLVPFARPLALAPFDRVQIVAPAGPFERPAFEAGLAALSRRYQPVYSDGLFAAERYLAGPDSRRLAELQQALHAPELGAVFAARGGYGTLRLLSGLNLAGAPARLVVGFSDVTALHALLQREGRISIHGPVLTQLGRQPVEVQEALFQLLEGNASLTLRGTHALVSGVVEGPLVGGNLSVFTRLLGTPYLPPLDGALLLLEDVGERPYRLDRMWTHLSLAGVFRRIGGIVLGDFTGCDEKDAGYGALDVLRRLALETGLPCAAGFPIGHGEINRAVPLGCHFRLDASAATLELLEPAVSPRAVA